MFAGRVIFLKVYIFILLVEQYLSKNVRIYLLIILDHDMKIYVCYQNSSIYVKCIGRHKYLKYDHVNDYFCKGGRPHNLRHNSDVCST